MRNLPLHVKIIIGLVLGIIWAFVSSSLGWNTFTINWIDPFGVIFIRLLKFIAVPLVLFSIISGISSLSDISKLGKIGFKTIGLYLATTAIAVTIGLIVVNLIKPGTHLDENQRIKNRISYELWVEETSGVKAKDNKDFLSDPKYAEVVAEVTNDPNRETSDGKAGTTINNATTTQETGPLIFLVEMVPDNIFGALSTNTMMLQVIFFAIFFGIMLALLPNEKVGPLIAVINGVNDVFLKMVEKVMEIAPYFVFALLAGVIAKMANTPAEVFEIFKGLGSYSVAVVIGLAFMVFVFYPLLATLFIRHLNYRQFFRNFSPAQFLAFSTSSSAATLPVTMECVEEKMGVPKNISSFVLPIGATINMDGTSLYMGIAVVFMAQLHLIDLTLGQQLTIVLTASLASIGTAAVPSAGLVMMIIVLQSVGLNPAWIAIIFPVDRILDMCRTVVNVTGDATVAALVASSEGELRKME